MGERYTRLFSLSEQLYIENAPVIIAAGALLKDNKTDNVLVQLKFQNIEEKQIKALTVQIIPLDIKNKKIGEKIEYQYLDLNEERDVYFGADVPIMVSNNNVRGFEVGVTEVIFKDNTEWEHEYISWGILEKPHLLKDTLKSLELVKQYKLKYGQDSTYTLKKEKRIWYCTCGALNHEDEKICHKCTKNLDKLESFNLSELETDVKIRLQDEQKQREKTREELKQKEIKKKKQTYIIVAVAVLAVIVGITANMAISDGKKKNAYNHAVTLMENEKFEEAIAQFKQLGSYKDSEEKYNELEYTLFPSKRITDYIKENGNYSENIELKTELYDKTFSGYCLDITSNEETSKADSGSSSQSMLYVDEEDSGNFWYDYKFSSEELNLKNSIYFTYSDEEDDEMKFTEYYEVPNGWTSQEGKTYDFRGTFYATIPIESYKMGESISIDFEVLEYLDTADNEWKTINATKTIGEASVTESVNDIVGKLQTYFDKNSDVDMKDLGFTIEE